MEKKEINQAITRARELSPKRKFKQSFDLIINLKNLDLKKADNQKDDYIELHYSKGRKVKVCALVGAELEPEAKKVCDRTIRDDEFQKLEKKSVRKIANEYDFFIAQANIMAQVAGTFGRALGPRGKMPNPKAGCVVPPKANLSPVYDKLQRTIKLTTKKGGSVKTLIGNEEMKDDEIADNIMNAYSHFIHILPQGENNVKNMMIKTTMGKAVKIGDMSSGEAETKQGKKSSKPKIKKQQSETEEVEE